MSRYINFLFVFGYCQYTFIINRQKIFIVPCSPIEFSNPTCIGTEPEIFVCILINTHYRTSYRTNRIPRLIMPQPFPFCIQFVYTLIVCADP